MCFRSEIYNILIPVYSFKPFKFLNISFYSRLSEVILRVNAFLSCHISLGSISTLNETYGITDVTSFSLINFLT